MKCAISENLLSTTVSIASFREYDLRKHMLKSIDMSTHGAAGTGRGGNSPGLRLCKSRVPQPITALHRGWGNQLVARAEKVKDRLDRSKRNSHWAIMRVNLRIEFSR